MASLQASADSIRIAVASSSCSPTTVTTLSDLLLPQSEPQINVPVEKLRRPVKAPIVAKVKPAKVPAARGRRKRVAGDEIHQDVDQLSPKERSILATEIINATLKSLSDAIRSPAPAHIRRQASSKDLVKATARRSLRRSNSVPQSPLQPRSLNRVASSPNIASRANRSSSCASVSSLLHRSNAECARLAFACLRALQANNTPGLNLPPLQLENGMSVLTGKLITLGLDDLAAKELRVLKRRLGQLSTQTKTVSAKADTYNTTQTLAELLDFGNQELSGATLGLVITTQLQVLRLITSSRKPKNVEEAFDILKPAHHSSPTRLILRAAAESSGVKQKEKAIRQLTNLSEILLSLSPSVSSAEDDLALESRLSVAPQMALQLQALALQVRYLWWDLADHKGDYSKDIFDPFLRCLSAFARRSQCGAPETYRVAAAATAELETLLRHCDAQPAPLKSILAGIYKLLGSLSKETNRLNDAIAWTEKLQNVMDVNHDSDAKRCAALARLVSLNLRKPVRKSTDEESLLALLEELERPFRGESSEIDDLMTEVSSARRSAISLLGSCKLSKPSSDDMLADGISQMCESLIFLCPRLCARYLGTKPDVKTAMKDVLRYEQRRRFIAKSASLAIDSALYLVKMLIGEGRVTWDLVDSKLQDCVFLLHGLEHNHTPDSLPEEQNPQLSHYARISNLYFTQFLNMRRDSENQKDSQQIRALRRATDSMRGRPQQEKKAAHLWTKLERMAEFCKSTGRTEELIATLLRLRDEIVNDGVLLAIAGRAATQPLWLAWTDSEEAVILGRTVNSLIKVQIKYTKPTAQVCLSEMPWSAEERGTVLEYQLEALSGTSTDSSIHNMLRCEALQQLLSIYDAGQYPLRRLRVILNLLLLDENNSKNLKSSVKPELATSAIRAITIEATKDEGLGRYLKHSQTLAITLLELQADEPSVEVVKEGLAVWSLIRGECTQPNSLEEHIDDVDGLRSHLYTIADYLQIKGHESIRVACLKLIADIDVLYDKKSSGDNLVMSSVCLGTQWLKLGYSGKAGLAFDSAKAYSDRNGVTPYAMLQLHLSSSEYLLTIGNLEKAEENLSLAQSIYALEKNRMPRSKTISHLQQKTQMDVLVSKAYMLYSMVALGRGAAHLALSHAKQSVRLLRVAWANIEHQMRAKTSASDETLDTEASSLADGISLLSLDSPKGPVKTPAGDNYAGSRFWTLVTPLLLGLTHISGLFAHQGMFRETIYYAEQAHKLAYEIGSQSDRATASVLLGSSWLKAGSLDRGSEYLMAAKQLSLPEEKSKNAALLAFRLGQVHGILGNHDAEVTAYEEAGNILENIIKVDFVNNMDKFTAPSAAPDIKTSRVTLAKRKVVVPRKAPARAKAATRRKAAPAVKAPIESFSSISTECPPLTTLKATVLRQKARSLMVADNPGAALVLLQEAEALISAHGSQVEVVDQGLAMAKQLLLQSVEQMNADPVYSVLQDSTISFPSIVGLSKSEKIGDRLSVGKLSPSGTVQAKSNRVRAGSRSPAPDSFFDKLRQAQEQLAMVQSIAVTVAPVSLIHAASSLSNSVAILLSAAGQVKGRSLAHPGLAVSSIETARTIAFRRDRKASRVDAQNASKSDLSSWPQTPSREARRSSISFISDMARFQSNYIDIIPKPWTVISISLSDSRQELSITKLQAGHSPFVLRLPLGRNNSIDADEEVFGFEQGHAELLDIIQHSNENAHDARSRTGKEAKTAWWEEREALDARLRDLLENVEKVWLGGFTGIFSQHERRPELLARFQRSFQNILDRHLPSRRKAGKRNANPRITLDSRILDLFIGLGDASDEDCDFSDPLTDLLYFVVDVLQFHGELNAYAEIDFDSIVIEIQDALRGYHVAARGHHEEGKHTILILDKALHCFPWESLPCMNGLAVSRLPSLGCLRDRILSQQDETEAKGLEGHYVSSAKGSYILNPSGDLTNTQKTFQKSLQSLRNWTGITNRVPSESEFRDCLESTELCLYFGHGSGAQYIRAREVKKLEKCAVTMLMGCSSGALVDTGEFEPYGTPINYMHAGCPALVATLWDVTDKDIDRFARSTFEKWGLFEAERKGKGVQKVEEGHKTSLVQAVAQGREACNLRYLNGAAAVVYGVPVYLR